MYRLYSDGSVVATSEAKIEFDEERGGWLIDGGIFSFPRDSIVKQVVFQLSPPAFLLQFTSPERIAIRAAQKTDPVIDDWMQIVNDPRLTVVDLSLQGTKDGLSYLVGKGILSAERRAAILQGIEL